MNEELLKAQLPTSSRVLKLVLHALIDYLLLQLPTGSCVLKLLWVEKSQVSE